MIRYIKLISTLVVVIIFMLANITNSFAFTYEKRVIGNDVRHIINIDPKLYKVELIRAQEVSGRETVSSIAKRVDAEIAINGGFFKISKDRKTIPSGTLIINGYVYNIIDQIQPFLLLNSNILSIKLANPKEYNKENTSIISGIPLLVKDGEIFEPLLKKESEFYVMLHARTALGIKPDGSIVIVVVEHNYLRDFEGITLGKVQSLMIDKEKMVKQKYNHKSTDDLTAMEQKEILMQEFSVSSSSQGLSVLDLAKLMKNLGCKDAINLDGGGSSTLWIKDKVINQTIGDKDESEGEKVERLVSDAIVFIKK